MEEDTDVKELEQIHISMCIHRNTSTNTIYTHKCQHAIKNKMEKKYLMSKTKLQYNSNVCSNRLDLFKSVPIYILMEKT